MCGSLMELPPCSLKGYESDHIVELIWRSPDLRSRKYLNQYRPKPGNPMLTYGAPAAERP